MTRFAFTTVFIISCAIGAFASGKEELALAHIEFFESKIRPVLVEHCYACHSSQEDAVKGGLRLDSREGWQAGGDSGDVIVLGKPAASSLISALRYEDLQMPPKAKLPESVIADFETWIRHGAVDPRTGPTTPASTPAINFVEAAQFWAFRPPALHAPPALVNPALVPKELDHFVLSQLNAAGLIPNPQANPQTLIRRAHFGLIGLPPTPDEIRSFQEEYQRDPDVAFAQLVDRLLESPQYGERWARHWLDVARYGEDQAHTFKARNYPRGYFYRDWVVDALNRDLPYDRFLQHQIAGDLLAEDNRHERLAALGLFALGPVYYAENVERAKAMADEWDDRIDTLMRGVLGLTVSCARCHDHKYDPLTMEDYYGIAGIFASTAYQERPIVADDIVRQRQRADDAVNQQQVAVGRFLATEAAAGRPSLIPEIPAYFVAAWEVIKAKAADKANQKQLEETAKNAGLSLELLKRWTVFLSAAPQTLSPEEQEIFAPWFELSASFDTKVNRSDDAAVRAQVEVVAKNIATKAADNIEHKDALFKTFGSNAAFVRAEDRATVRPGIIPLGNLFDDSVNVALDTALTSDRFRAVASAESLGIDRVAKGWGARLEIAPKISFDFLKIGSDVRTYGQIVNDSWGKEGAIRTAGKPGGVSSSRLEQGIGMHANALLTFDLDEIRVAGFMPPNQRFFFKVDRAGLNDDVHGAPAASAHIAVIISKPRSNDVTADSIIASSVNNHPMELATDDFTYYFANEVPPPLQPNGEFFEITMEIPSEAKYLTLVTTGAGMPQENTISSDHVVFSGARLEMDPLPAATSEDKQVDDGNDLLDDKDRHTAILLSRLLYDDGLLALPPAEIEPHLGTAATQTLKELRNQHTALKAAAEAIEIPLAHSLVDGKSQDLPIYLKGNPANQAEIALRAMPRILSGLERIPFRSQGSGRLELAQAITSKENPLTARVIVNRVWAGHFGFGLVRTLSNFGQLGERPSHPQLLDTLAVRFMQNGWSLKWLHREIMNSATYQRGSDFHPENYERDPENRFLWRMNRRRLEIEPWRDSMLAVGNDLDSAMGGPSADLTQSQNHRRTIYGFVSRHRLNELLRLFDFPDPSITAAGRTVTTVPLQQLFVLNSDFMMERAQALAKRIHQTISGSDLEKLAFAYQLVFSRLPLEDEVTIALEFLAHTQTIENTNLDNWEQLSLALLSSNEFMYLD